MQLDVWMNKHQGISGCFWLIVLAGLFIGGINVLMRIDGPIEPTNVCVTTPDGEVCGRDTSGRSW